jgi:hypothetical protein
MKSKDDIWIAAWDYTKLLGERGLNLLEARES